MQAPNTKAEVLRCFLSLGSLQSRKCRAKSLDFGVGRNLGSNPDSVIYLLAI